MPKLPTPLCAVMLAVAAAGCGTTQIVASDPQARIWVDGEFIGRGHGEVRRVGFPGGAHVMAKTDDGRNATQSLHRSFGWTAMLGLFTYGVCFIACWEYPNALFIDLPPAPTPGSNESPGADPWLIPAAGWHAPAPSPAAPTPDAKPTTEKTRARPAGVTRTTRV